MNLEKRKGVTKMGKKRIFATILTVLLVVFLAVLAGVFTRIWWTGLLVGAILTWHFLIRGLKQVDLDPPTHEWEATFCGKRTGYYLGEGWHWLPIFCGAKPVGGEKKKRSSDFMKAKKKIGGFFLITIAVSLIASLLSVPYLLSVEAEREAAKPIIYVSAGETKNIRIPSGEWSGVIVIRGEHFIADPDGKVTYKFPNDRQVNDGPGLYVKMDTYYPYENETFIFNTFNRDQTDVVLTVSVD